MKINGCCKNSGELVEKQSITGAIKNYPAHANFRRMMHASDFNASGTSTMNRIELLIATIITIKTTILTPNKSKLIKQSKLMLYRHAK